MGFLVHTGFDPHFLGNTVNLGGDYLHKDLSFKSDTKTNFDINCNATKIFLFLRTVNDASLQNNTAK